MSETIHGTIQDSKSIWIVSVNSDLTEGRGHNVIKANCELEATARRIAKGADVQGSNGRVDPGFAYKIRNCWYVRGTPTTPSRNDIKQEGQLKALHEARQKARDAGLTDDEIRLLGMKL